MKFNANKIPNILTILRILLFPIVVFFIFYKINIANIIFSINKYQVNIPLNIWLAGVLFLIASITDALDGYLARKNNWISSFGKVWDPIADKLLINSILISFSVIGYVPFYITIIMISRDTIVDAYRMMAAKNNIDVAADKLGKLKTIFQMIGILIIFFIFNNNDSIWNIPGISNHWQYYVLQNSFLFIAVFFSIVSGINYIFKFSKKDNLY